jgi:amidophosphoribosyltransferase
MPSSKELIAFGRNEEEVAREIGVDRLIYQSIEDLISDCASINTDVSRFETSCFTGEYVTGDITLEYLSEVEGERNDEKITHILNADEDEEGAIANIA